MSDSRAGRVLVVVSVLALTAAGLGLWWWMPAESVADSLVPVDVSMPPVQGPTLDAEPFPLGPGDTDTALVPRAHMSLSARVLGNRAYYNDPAGVASPRDLALGWGIMASDDVAAVILVRQGSRFMSYSSSQPGLPWDEISRSTANVHVIPASGNLARAMGRLRPGDEVYLDGILVDVVGSFAGQDFTMETSLTREDRGPGACEVLYVTEMKLDGRIYR